MIIALLIGAAASSALVVGALLGSTCSPPKEVTGVLLAFASERSSPRSPSSCSTRLSLSAAQFGQGSASWQTLNANLLSVALGFAGGAVLASLADTVMPEAFDGGGPLVAFATTAGFFLSFVLAA